MSEFKGTPGPWRLGPYAHVVLPSHDLPESKGGGIGICHVYGTEKRKHNAKLIAAAPALLEVLQEVQEFAQGWSQYEMPIGLDDRINAAIAKALNTDTKGEGHE
jgi:hypothetical protein